MADQGSNPNSSVTGRLPDDRFVAYEDIDGLPLDEFLTANPGYFSERRRVDKFIREFTEALDSLHGNGILHLDINPSNVMLTRIGAHVKLIPERRGGESAGSVRTAETTDYYGLGKLLEYIRVNTPDYPSRYYKGLERRLLSDSPASRLASGKEVWEFLRTVKTHKGLYISGATLMAAAVMAVAWLLHPEKARPEPETHLPEAWFAGDSEGLPADTVLLPQTLGVSLNPSNE